MDAYQRVISECHDNLAKLASARNLLFILWRDLTEPVADMASVCVRHQ